MPLSLLTTHHMISTFSTNPHNHFKYYSHAHSPHPTKLHCPFLTFNSSADKTASRPSPSFDRRDVLLGLGGLCGAAANLGYSNQQAGAKPVAPPDLKDCRLPKLPMDVAPTSCCPPHYTGKVIDFKHPSVLSPMRRRRPAHLLDDAYAEKYNHAVELMKQLEDSDPRSFRHQANLHCAYCDAAYNQVGFPVEIQVHSSWLFFPWHRFYLYFHERILGKLLGDDTFALPFWNWDSPQGMSLPTIYATHPALRDEHRDPKHQPPALLTLDYNLIDPDDEVSSNQLISDNLTIMYRQLVSNGKTAELFLGSPYHAGDDPNPGAGSVENIPHQPVHLWVGDRSQPNVEDMGTFYSAARDPIFFAHHGNIDRMWAIWKGLNRKDFDDPDWLNAAFLFYDENAELVRVKVADCLDTTKLRYAYEEVDLPWLQAKPKASTKTPTNISKTVDAFGSDPRTLTSTIRASVKRSKWSRTEKEKEEEEEILVIQGIEVRRDVFVKFDICVNLNIDGEENAVGPGSHKFAGSFTNLPHNYSETDGDGKAMKLKTSLKLGLTDLLEDIGADGDEEIEVSLIIKAGNGEDITIGGIRIEFGS